MRKAIFVIPALILFAAFFIAMGCDGGSSSSSSSSGGGCDSGSSSSSSGGSTGDITGASCTSTGTTYVYQTIVVSSGTYDGQCKTFVPIGMGDGGQGEDQDPVFRVENGATLKNVIIGEPGVDGIHLYTNATIDNVMPEIWNYEVSGKRVVWQWFSYRRRNRTKPVIGDRRPPPPLDALQPDHWLGECTTDPMNLLHHLVLRKIASNLIRWVRRKYRFDLIVVMRLVRFEYRVDFPVVIRCLYLLT